MTIPSTVHLTIMTPQGVLHQGDVHGVSVRNDYGPCDIIEKHTNFLSVITDKIVIHQSDSTQKEIPITHGIIHVTQSGVAIFLGFDAERKNGGTL